MRLSEGCSEGQQGVGSRAQKLGALGKWPCEEGREGTALVVQWLRLHSQSRSLGSIPGQ